MRSANLPLWIVGAALLGWGWEVDAVALAVPLAALSVGPLLLDRRFGLERTEFHRTADVCWVLGAGGLMLVYSRESAGNVVRNFAQWLPVVAFPSLLAQVWSAAGRTPGSAVIPLPAWRRRMAEGRQTFDLAPPFVIICLLSASAAGAARLWFYGGLVAVVGAMLFARRAPGMRIGATLGLIAMASVGGWYVSVGLAGFQQWIEGGMLEWMGRIGHEIAPNQLSRTAIGRTGHVGGSSEVVLCLRTAGVDHLPRLLHVASYSEWQPQGGTWNAPQGGFEKVEGTADEWVLDGTPGLFGVIMIEWARSSTRGLIPLPAATHVLRDLPADGLERTPLGAVRAEIRGGVVSFRAEFAAKGGWESRPNAKDVGMIPAVERPAIDAAVEELSLKGQPPDEILRRVRGYFQRNFKYSTELTEADSADPRAKTPLGVFLLGHRTGHCEYFATAATLMLRAAGVPSRYVTGFLVDPGERLGETVVVRESEGHAWVRVWSDGAWSDFDPTPSVDTVEPDGAISWIERVRRRWHEMRFEAARWWWLGEKRLLRQAYWLAAPLLGGLLWRLRRLRTATSRVGQPSSGSRPGQWPGGDSEWYTVESQLASHGWAQRIHESRMAWRERLVAAGWFPDRVKTAVDARVLHERLRFDPRGLESLERTALRRLAGEVLSDIALTRGREGEPRGATSGERPQ